MDLFYKIVVFVIAPLLGIGWVAYWWNERRLDAQEEENPKKTTSEALKKSRSEVSDWAQQMASFKKPPGPGQRQDEQ